MKILPPKRTTLAILGIALIIVGFLTFQSCSTPGQADAESNDEPTQERAPEESEREDKKSPDENLEGDVEEVDAETEVVATWEKIEQTIRESDAPERATAWGRRGHAMAYDAAREMTVVFGGLEELGEKDPALFGDIQGWDGENWRDLEGGNGPGGRLAHDLVYDGARERLVTYGGGDLNEALADTWEWDGESWHKVAGDDDGPGSLRDYAMVYDEAREQVLVFGGWDAGTWRGSGEMSAELWAWDGESWQMLDDGEGEGPGARAEARMAYDASRGQAVLFGGVEPRSDDGDDEAPPLASDTWVWDGERWKSIAEEGPQGRVDHIMVYDASQENILLFGGSEPYHQSAFRQTRDDAWRWDGEQWSEVSFGERPRMQASKAAYDKERQRTVVFGGYQIRGPAHPDTRVVDKTWEFDGVRWELIAGVSSGFSTRSAHSFDFDAAREEFVLFGGRHDFGNRALSDTWLWDGELWRRVVDGGDDGPGPRYGHASVWDGSSERVLVVGGIISGQDERYGDTWAWDGEGWHDVAGDEDGPGPRGRHVMAYDNDRSRVVLFGGHSVREGQLGDTWEWDGSKWQKIDTGDVAPAPRQNAAMTYDAAREQIVLFGGLGQDFEPLGDTWVYDGERWTMASPDGEGPSPRQSHSMDYIGGAEVVFLFAGDEGRDMSAHVDDQWVWDGSSWREVDSGAAVPRGRYLHATSYSPADDALFLFGGQQAPFRGYAGEYDDTWRLELDKNAQRR